MVAIVASIFYGIQYGTIMVFYKGNVKNETAMLSTQTRTAFAGRLEQ
jgi:hypothetical protein